MSKSNVIADADRESILLADGVYKNCLDQFNLEIQSIDNLIENYPDDEAWSHTLVNSKSNCVTLIAQMPGQGNRRHFHPAWDEWWLIIQGEWEWEIEGVVKAVKTGDFVFIERNRKHKITAAGSGQSIRMAVSRADVDHVYDPEDYNSSSL